MRVSVGDVSLYFDVEGMGLSPPMSDNARATNDSSACMAALGPDHSFLKSSSLAPLADMRSLQSSSTTAVTEEVTRVHPDRWNLDTWVAGCAAEFRKVLEIEKPILLGQSFGGFVALGVAIRHPELPAKLILSSTAARMARRPRVTDVRAPGR